MNKTNDYSGQARLLTLRGSCATSIELAFDIIYVYLAHEGVNILVGVMLILVMSLSIRVLVHDKAASLTWEGAMCV
jgi:hypothetical protein